MRTLINYVKNLINFTSCCSQNSSKNTVPPVEIFDWSKVKPFIPPIKGGIVIKVYDGDTITIVSRLPYEDSELFKFSIRLKGIDCPEIKSPNEDEKQLAIDARDALSRLLLHKFIILKNISTEKYGRILADVYLDEKHINKWMLEQKFAIEYNGGTKQKSDFWIKYHKQL
jgi:micrococcal nuclease